MNICDFTYNWYVNLISLLYDNKYNAIKYNEQNCSNKSFIMRHDVDFDIDKTVEFAIKEAEIFGRYNYKGATYFLLISSEFYNMLSKHSLNAADKILGLGNDIGLHFDETKYNFNGNVSLLKEYVEEELSILGQALGTKINTVSMHRPSKLVFESNIEFKNAINTYSNAFIKDFKYVSDSKMNWREDVISIIMSNNYNRLHILTHPFWYSDKSETTEYKLKQFIRQANKKRYNNVFNNFRDLDEFVKAEDII